MGKVGSQLPLSLLRQIWTHPFDVLHSSVQTTLGSVETNHYPAFHATSDSGYGFFFRRTPALSVQSSVKYQMSGSKFDDVNCTLNFSQLTSWKMWVPFNWPSSKDGHQSYTFCARGQYTPENQSFEIEMVMIAVILEY